MKRPNKKDFSQQEILNQAKYNLDRVSQWREYPLNQDWVERHLKYLIQAECLIELLETRLCGQVGGYDKNQPEQDHLDLVKRFNWIKTHL